MTGTANDPKTLRLLKAELQFIEMGGYHRAHRTAWRPPAIFLDSPTCINFATPYKVHPCDECALMQFVPADYRQSALPCQYIPLTEHGETVKSAEAWLEQREIEDLVKAWLRKTIGELEEKLRRSAEQSQVA
jgi:hypothetical protein